MFIVLKGIADAKLPGLESAKKLHKVSVLYSYFHSQICKNICTINAYLMYINLLGDK
jgi:hypothetical protein